MKRLVFAVLAVGLSLGAAYYALVVRWSPEAEMQTLLAEAASAEGRRALAARTTQIHRVLEA